MGLRGIFDPENGFFRTLSRMVDVVGLSLLWVALSLPLVTFGPACAALYHTVTHCVVRQGDSTYLTFFRSFRANLRVGIPAGLLVLAAGALLLQGYQIMVLAANSVGGGALGIVGMLLFVPIFAMFGLLCLVMAALFGQAAEIKAENDLTI